MLKNKKADMAVETVVRAALYLLILVVVAGALIYGIFLKDQVEFAEEQSERISQDCDDDGVIGIGDQCPCDPTITKKEGKPECTASKKAKEKCPSLCEK